MSKTSLLYDGLQYAVDHPKAMDNHVISKDASERIAKRIAPYMKKIVVFKMEDDFTIAAVKLALNHPDILAEFSRRVRLPFDHVMLEWNNRLALETMLDNFGMVNLSPGTPDTTGALCHRMDDEVIELSSLCSTPPDDKISIGVGQWSIKFSPDVDWPAHTGFAHDLLRPWDVHNVNFYEIKESGYDHHIMVPFLWGGIPWQGKHYHEAQVQWDAAKSLSRRVQLKFSRYEGDLIVDALKDNRQVTYKEVEWLGGRTLTGRRKDAVMDGLRHSVREEFGFAKIAIAALALLNAKDRIVEWSDPIDRQGKLYTGKRFVPYHTYRTIRLRLPLPQVIRQVRAAAFHIRRRQHDVMGHWCSSNLRGNPACAHEYMDLDPKRKECRLCQHRIWFKPAFKRGDASLGIVSHKYEVTKR